MNKRHLSIICLLCAGPVVGAEQDFADFLGGFRAAVAGNDAGRVADMTRLPFLFAGRPHGRDEFVELYPTLFDAAVRSCLAEATALTEAADRVLFCPPYAFYFDNRDGGWKLREFNADGEDMP
ncbi:hypothetical protein NP590_01200 [Methylomonas sp. SURF-2]|uniref:Uncharacterized protein n=1 Tax=Methylomonas subterranea TaxID=2952225 RepID=A0ABT1TBC0_9GAMM|nr:hypothetical protein [Methylomonas sp. SURF-2]MCQ8102705.1 hypothetical protein [Methylomonas sp. SURF-2]